MRIPVDIPTAVFSDSFTDSNSTAIDAHTPTIEYSGGWVQSASTAFYIQSNTLQPNRQTDGDRAVIESGLSDFNLTAVVTPFAGSGTRAYPGVIFRYTDSSNFWYAYPGATDNTVIMYSVEAGIATERMYCSLKITTGVAITLEIRCKGPNITLRVNGQEQATYVSTFNQTATQVGVRYGKSGSPASVCSWNSISVTSFFGHSFNWPIFTELTPDTPLVAKGASGSWEDSDINDPNVIYDSTNNRFALLYSGYKSGDASTKQQLGNAYADTITGPYSKDTNNPIFAGTGNDIQNGGVINFKGTYYYYYGTTSNSISVATSSDLVTWTTQQVALGAGLANAWDGLGVYDAFARVREDGNTIELWYGGHNTDSAIRGIGFATSTDGLNFTRSPRNPIVANPTWGVNNIGEPSVYVPSGKEGKEMMLFFDSARSGNSGHRVISQAVTVDGGNTWYFRVGALRWQSSGWESIQVFDSFPYYQNGILYLFHAGADTSGGALSINAQIGVASAPFSGSFLGG